MGTEFLHRKDINWYITLESNLLYVVKQKMHLTHNLALSFLTVYMGFYSHIYAPGDTQNCPRWLYLSREVESPELSVWKLIN